MKRIIRYIKFRIIGILRHSKIKTNKIFGKISIGKHVRIDRRVFIGDNVTIGNYTYFNTQFDSIYIERNTKIGNYCSIAPGVLIGLGEHPIKYVTTHPILFNKKYKVVKDNINTDGITTIIGNDVWIGARAIIKQGVTIGNGAIIGMNAVVTRDVPPYGIAVGCPARIKKYRFDSNTIAKLESDEWWKNDEAFIKKNISLMYDAIKFTNRKQK